MAGQRQQHHRDLESQRGQGEHPSLVSILLSVSWMAVLASLLGVCLTGPSLLWADVGGPRPKIAAAGFGREVDGVSTITVKMYDVATGEILSDDTYELDVKDSLGGHGPQPRARIFAGGVGPDAVDLSNFVLRVYDAHTGRFQWEGQLNLVPAQDESAARAVSSRHMRRARVTSVATPPTASTSPSFLLRARDPVTGHEVWKDEFSTDGRAAVERLGEPQPKGADRDAESLPAFEFRIRMFEAGGSRLLWEDEVKLEDLDDAAEVESRQEQATMLPNSPGHLKEWTRRDQI